MLQDTKFKSKHKWIEEAKRIALYHNNFDHDFLVNKLIERGLNEPAAIRAATKALKPPTVGRRLKSIYIGLIISTLCLVGLIMIDLSVMPIVAISITALISTVITMRAIYELLKHKWNKEQPPKPRYQSRFLGI